MKRVFAFVQICLYILGVIGGIGWTLFSQGYVITVGIVGLAYMAFPKLKECFNILTNG